MQRYDPPRSMAGRFGGIRVKNWQAHGDLTILAGYAPQETGLRNTRSTSGIKLQRQWQSFRDAHPLFSEETSTGTPAGRRGDRVATPMRESHGQWCAHRRDLQSSASLEPVDLGCEIGAIEPLLGGKHLARIHWRTKQT